MVYDELTLSQLVSEIEATVVNFPENRRGSWAEEILDPFPKLRKFFSFQNNSRDILPDESNRRQLIAALDGLRDRKECIRQAHWIKFTLRRTSIYSQWKELLLDALSSNEIVAISKSEAKLADWIAATYSVEFPPDILDVVPPLDAKCLANVRRHIDRFAKRLLRHPKTSGIAVIPELEGDEFQGTLDARIDVSLLLENLTKLEKQVLYLRFIEGFSLAEIANDLGVSVSTAYRNVGSAVEQARNFLEGTKGK